MPLILEPQTGVLALIAIDHYTLAVSAAMLPRTNVPAAAIRVGHETIAMLQAVLEGTLVHPSVLPLAQTLSSEAVVDPAAFEIFPIGERFFAESV